MQSFLSRFQRAFLVILCFCSFFGGTYAALAPLPLNSEKGATSVISPEEWNRVADSVNQVGNSGVLTGAMSLLTAVEGGGISFGDRNVGIGVSSPTFPLHIKGASTTSQALFSVLNGNDQEVFSVQGNGFISAPQGGIATSMIESVNTGETMFLNAYNNGSVVLATGGGNVGIGISSPTAKLHVVGNLKVGENDFFVGNGNVGIGTPDPRAKLEIKDETGMGSAKVIINGSLAPNLVFAESDTIVALIAATNNIMRFYIGAAESPMHLTSSGVTATGYYYASDESLKKDIQTVQSPLDKVKQLRGVEFTWKKDDKPSLGLIAQEVEEVLPELVNTGENGIKSVQYGNLVALLIEAIKEQNLEIETLKAEMASQK